MDAQRSRLLRCRGWQRNQMNEILFKLYVEPVARQYLQVKLVMKRAHLSEKWEFQVINPENGETLDHQHEDALEWISWG